MPEKIDELLRTAKEIQKQAAQRAARPAHGIAAGQIAGTSQIQGPANELAGRGADREAHAHARHRQGYCLPRKPSTPCPPPTPTMNPPLVKTTLFQQGTASQGRRWLKIPARWPASFLSDTSS